MQQPSTTLLPARDLRQRDIVPPERLAECQALVVGVGAIGRQVALQLAAMGVPRLILYDHDVVAIENLAPQGYWVADVGATKVAATAAACALVNPAVQVTPVPEPFKRSTAARLPADGRLAVFACVDAIGTRRLLWEVLRQRAALFVDGRMSAEVVRVLAVDGPGANSTYAGTLFAAAEAYAGP